MRNEWARDFGLHVVNSASFADALENVCRKLNVVVDNEVHQSSQNTVLFEGCRRLGMACKRTGQNVTGRHECGWCGMGCKSSGKQSACVTYLKDGAIQGAKFLIRTRVTRVTHSGGKVNGVEVEDSQGNRLIIPTKVRVTV